MDYWMTFKKDAERSQATASTAREALDVIKSKQREGFDLVRIVDKDGTETSAYALGLAIDSVKVEST